MPITGIQQKIWVKFALFGAFYLLLIKSELSQNFRWFYNHSVMNATDMKRVQVIQLRKVERIQQYFQHRPVRHTA